MNRDDRSDEINAPLGPPLGLACSFATGLLASAILATFPLWRVTTHFDRTHLLVIMPLIVIMAIAGIVFPLVRLRVDTFGIGLRFPGFTWFRCRFDDVDHVSNLTTLTFPSYMSGITRIVLIKRDGRRKSYAAYGDAFRRRCVELEDRFPRPANRPG